MKTTLFTLFLFFVAINITLAFDSPSVYIIQNDVMSTDLLLWYDINTIDNDEFVGFITLAYDGTVWSIAQIDAHNEHAEFYSNLDYINGYANSLVIGLNGLDNQVYLPVVQK